jgi:hypothetical protein
LVVSIDAEFSGIVEIHFAADHTTINHDQLKNLTDIGNYFHSNIHAVHVMGSESKDEINLLTKKIEDEILKKTNYPQIDIKLLYGRTLTNDDS